MAISPWAWEVDMDLGVAGHDVRQCQLSVVANTLYLRDGLALRLPGGGQLDILCLKTVPSATGRVLSLLGGLCCLQSGRFCRPLRPVGGPHSGLGLRGHPLAFLPHGVELIGDGLRVAECADGIFDPADDIGQRLLMAASQTPQLVDHGAQAGLGEQHRHRLCRHAPLLSVALAPGPGALSVVFVLTPAPTG
jgi:hypothetical protein